MSTHKDSAAGGVADPVAVIGLAFRFPGKNDTTAAFWEFIKSAKVAICDTPADRFDIDACFSEDPDMPGTTYARRAGYVSEPYAFDHEFFRISMAEALEMDPQQRWMLQLCWSALENAGILPSDLRGRRVGIFLTAGDVDYAHRTVNAGDPKRITFYGKLGANRAVGAGRVAFTLGLQGPAIYLDSTCSSSLAAIHLAAQSLRCGDCDLAIAGGVNLILGPEETIGFARLRAMSPSDLCRPFDNRADGYSRGEGGAAVVLKRADDAAADKDRIEALLVGSSVNNDGASNGLTAPNGAAQEAVIRQALAKAGAKPEDVLYVEAHGTGTSLGDPIELSALRNAYAAPGTRRDPLHVRALKAQIGHLEGAAGIAGFIKAILVLRHGYVPPQANFETPTARFRWDDAMVEVSNAGFAVNLDERLVGVSAFGINGTNAHALLAPPPWSEVKPVPERMRVLTLSGRTPASLRALSAAYLEVLRQPGTILRDLVYTASVRRQHWDCRLAVVGTTHEAMAEALAESTDGHASGRWHIKEKPAKTRVAFLFPGQGAWRPGVGGQLYRDNPLFRSFAEDCLSRLAPPIAGDVRKAILDGEPRWASHHPGQLGHFVVLHSLARLWMALGITPDLVIGHSLGEHVASVIAGVMSLDDGLRIVQARGQLFDALKPPGAMLAAAANTEWLGTVLKLGDDLFIAAINGPEQTVLSGTAEAIQAAEDRLRAEGLRVSRIQAYDTPGHSPLLRPVADAFRAVVQSVDLTPPKIPIVSTVTGDFVRDVIATPDYWADMVERPVLFHAALSKVIADNFMFLEVGPGAALANLTRAAAGDWGSAITTFCDGPEGADHPEPDGFAHACAKLYCAGHAPDWTRLYGSSPVPAEAPTYAFDTKHIELPRLRSQAAVAFHQVIAEDDEPHRPSLGGDASNTASVEAVLAEILDAIEPVTGAVADLDDSAPLVALGFDSLALTEMRVRLHERFGRSLPMAVLAAGASLRAVAEFYAGGNMRRQAPDDQDRVSIVSSPLPPDGLDLVVTLRKGRGEVVALVHPVGGDVLCYSELAAAWRGDATIVALRHPNMESGTPRYRSVSVLAALYREALLAALGAPPRIVGGWSFGGIIAQEMARQWEAEGRPPAAVMAIDSPLPGADRAARALALLGTIDHADDDDLLEKVIDHPGFRWLFDEQHGLKKWRQLLDSQTAARIFRIHAANAMAFARHETQPIQTPYWYALALHGDNVAAVDAGLAKVSLVRPTVLGFDRDHFSIMLPPAVQAVAGFLGTAPTQAGHVAPRAAE